jgi:hypothetical protein
MTTDHEIVLRAIRRSYGDASITPADTAAAHNIIKALGDAGWMPPGMLKAMLLCILDPDTYGGGCDAELGKNRVLISNKALRETGLDGDGWLLWVEHSGFLDGVFIGVRHKDGEPIIPADRVDLGKRGETSG